MYVLEYETLYKQINYSKNTVVIVIYVVPKAHIETATVQQNRLRVLIYFLNRNNENCK